MSSRGKLLLSSILAMLVVSMAISSTAMAIEEQPHYIKGKAEVTTELKGLGTIGEFFIEVPGFKLTILCKGVDNKVGIGPKWESKLTIEFKECSVFENGILVPGCEVKEPIVVNLLDQLVYKKGKKAEELLDIFYPAKGTEFARVTLREGCGAEAGIHEVEGSAIAVMNPNAPGTESIKHELKFNGEAGPTGTYFNHHTKTEEAAGKMLWAGKPAYLKGEIKQELASGEKYGAE
jgi:hypothetical protein